MNLTLEKVATLESKLEMKILNFENKYKNLSITELLSNPDMLKEEFDHITSLYHMVYNLGKTIEKEAMRDDNYDIFDEWDNMTIKLGNFVDKITDDMDTLEQMSKMYSTLTHGVKKSIY